jgi:hypothetical protein
MLRILIFTGPTKPSLGDPRMHRFFQVIFQRMTNKICQRSDNLLKVVIKAKG